jgi:superfamily II DNA or RNA helicase
MFGVAGVPAAHLDGSTPAHKREAIFEDMRKGEVGGKGGSLL